MTTNQISYSSYTFSELNVSLACLVRMAKERRISAKTLLFKAERIIDEIHRRALSN